MDVSCAGSPPAFEQCSAPRASCYRPWGTPTQPVHPPHCCLACLPVQVKLHYLPGPPQLLSVLPPRHITSTNPRTRREHRAVSGHDHQLQHQLPASAPLALKRSFPHCSISDWNSLPAALLSQPPHSKRMQSFKTNVYRHLRSTNWLWAVDSLWIAWC